MNSYNLNPLIESFNQYIIENAEAEDINGTRKEFTELLKSIFSTFDCRRAAKEALLARKKEHDSFLRICDALRAAEDEDTCVAAALAYSGRAAVKQALGDLEGAARDYRRSADTAAGSDFGTGIRIAAVANLSSTLLKLNKPEESVKCLNEAEKLILKEGQTNSGVTGRLISVKADRGCIFCRLGKLAEANADFTDAIACFDVIEEPSEDMKRALVKSLANRSGILVGMKNFEQARLDGLRALALDGSRVTQSTPVTLTNLAAACKCLGYFEEAEAHYTRVIMLKTMAGNIKTLSGQVDLATLILGRGEVRDKLDRLADAESDYTVAIEMYRKALGDFEKVVRPRLAGALKKRGALYGKTGKIENSEKDLAEAEKLADKALDE